MPRLPLLFGGLAVSFCVATLGCSKAEAPDENTSPGHESLFAATGLFWPGGVVPVCWVNPHDNQGMAWTREALANTWAAHADVHFTGWGTCNGPGKMVRIRIDDDWPNSNVGTWMDQNADTVTMHLSFTWNIPGTDPNFPDPFATCRDPQYREACIRSTAVHEFGHALGFDHEQQRPDTPDTNPVTGARCPRDTAGDYPHRTLGPWDPNSVMNYCNGRPANDKGELSAGDIAGVQAIYGPPPLYAQFVNHTTTALPDPEGKAHYQVCTREVFQYGFDLRNAGKLSWVDWGDGGGGLGQRVRLGTPDSQPDVFARTPRVSVSANANVDVHSEGGECNHAPLCNRTAFSLTGTAPETPGIYTTTWQLVDEGRRWFGPAMWLSYNVIDCDGGGGPPMESRADVNGDGNADLVTVAYRNPGLRVNTLLSNGDGTFAPRSEDLWDGYGVDDTANWKLGDLNGDGKTDLVNAFYLPGKGMYVLTFLSKGDGTWTPGGELSWPHYGVNDSRNWQVADVDGNGKDDLVDVLYLAPGLRIHTLLSNGNGTFAIRADDPWPGYGFNDVKNWKVADVDGDQKADLVDAFYLAPGLRVHSLRSKGDGTWVGKADDHFTSYGANDMHNWKVADLNGDGNADIVNTLFLSSHGLFTFTLRSKGAGFFEENAALTWPGYGANDATRWQPTR